MRATIVSLNMIMLTMATPRHSMLHESRMVKTRGQYDDFPAAFIPDEANSTPKLLKPAPDLEANIVTSGLLPLSSAGKRFGR